MEFIIYLYLKLSLDLDNLKPNFSLKLSVFSIVDNFDLVILLDKRFFITVSSLKLENLIILLAYLSLRKSTFATGLYISNFALNSFNHTTYITQ